MIMLDRNVMSWQGELESGEGGREGERARINRLGAKMGTGCDVM